MATGSMSLASRDRGDVTRILTAGMLVAILDIAFAALVWVVIRAALTPAQLLQSIAAGLLGKAAYSGGPATAALGAALHFSIAYAWTAVYFVAVRHSSGLRRLVGTEHGAVKAGLVFGVLIWLVMDFVVLPLSRATPTPVASWWFAAQLLWHPVGVGLPIALIVGRGATR